MYNHLLVGTTSGVVDDAEQHVCGSEDERLVDVQQPARVGAAAEEQEHHQRVQAVHCHV